MTVTQMGPALPHAGGHHRAAPRSLSAQGSLSVPHRELLQLWLSSPAEKAPQGRHQESPLRKTALRGVLRGALQRKQRLPSVCEGVACVCVCVSDLALSQSSASWRGQLCRWGAAAHGRCSRRGHGSFGDRRQPTLEGNLTTSFMPSCLPV